MKTIFSLKYLSLWLKVYFHKPKRCEANNFFEYVITAMWEKAKQYKFPDILYLNSLPVEDQCEIIAEIFAELEIVMTAGCESESEKLASLLFLANNVC